MLSNIRTLHLQPCTRGTTRIPPTVRHLRLHGNLGKSVVLLADALPSLQSLAVYDSFRGDIMLPLAASVSSLTALALEFTPVPRPVAIFLATTHFPALRNFAHSRASFPLHDAQWLDPFLRTHASQLASLHCGWLPTDAALESVRFPRLTRLTLASAPSDAQCAAIIRNSPKLAAGEVHESKLPSRTTAVTSLDPTRVHSKLDAATLRSTYPRLRSVSMTLSSAVNSAYLLALVEAEAASLVTEIRITYSTNAATLASFLSAATQLRALHIPFSATDLAATVSSVTLSSLRALVLQPEKSAPTHDTFRCTLHVVRCVLSAAPRLSWMHFYLPFLSADDVAEVVTLARDLERRCVSCHVVTPSYKALHRATAFLSVHAWATLGADCGAKFASSDEREEALVYGDGLAALWSDA